jgi:hypothetical protein
MYSAHFMAALTQQGERSATRALSVFRILGNVRHDLIIAEEVARKIWPNRKVQLSGEQPCVLADKLKEQAAAAAKALEDGPNVQ